MPPVCMLADGISSWLSKCSKGSWVCTCGGRAFPSWCSNNSCAPSSWLKSCMPCTCGWPQRRAWNSLRSPCRCWSSCWLTPRHEPWERACAVCWCAKATSRDLSALLDAINPSSRPCLNPTCLLLLTWCASGRSAMVGANASLVPIVRAFNRVFSLSF